MKKIFSFIVLAVVVLFLALQVATLSQTPQQSVQATVYSNVTSSSRLDGCLAGYPCIDNRSQYTRRNSYLAYRAFGTGTWSVDMQYADNSPTVWTSYGVTAQVSNVTPLSGIGFGLGPSSTSKPYHDYTRFVITGSATIQNYFGTSQAWWSTVTNTVSFPITSNQGGTGSGSAFNNVSSAADAATWAAAVSTAPNGSTILADNTFTPTITSGATLASSNVTIQCSPGSVFKAGANGLVLLTNTGSNNIIDGCTFDGQFSQGRTGGTGISATGGASLTIRNSKFQNIGAFGISVNGLTGNFISSYNQFLNIGNGVCCNTNSSAGLLIANASTSAAKPTLIISSHDICSTLTTGGCVKMFQENVAVKTTIIIEDEICHAIGTYCAEGSTVAAISVKITNQHSDQYIANASGGLGAVSWEMGGKIAGVEVSDNDGQILIDGQTADQGAAGTAGHGIVNEIFSPHLQLTNSRSTGAFAEWTKLSGGGIISGNSVKGAWISIGQNATYDVAPITITSNRFSENCSASVQASAASINMSDNTFLRTPSACSADATTTYVGYQGGANQTGLTGSGIFNNNLFVINSGTIGTFGWIGISRGAAADEYDLFNGNKFLNYNAAAFGAAFADGAGRQMDYATIVNSTFTNMLTIGFTSGATHGIRIANNVDTSGTLASVPGAYIIANQEVVYNSTPNCTAFNRGVTIAVSNSTTATWGATMASGGAFHVTGICNPTIPGFTVISK